MATISITNMARAIYASTKDKTGDNLDNTLLGSIKILSNNGMLSKSDAVLEKLENLIDKDQNIVRAKIYTAHKIGSENINQIEHELKHRYKAEKIYITVIEDSKLLGGIKIQIADEIIDLSLEKKVTQLKKHLLN